MGSITETPEWEEQVYLIETTDAVIGGEEGIANRQSKQLANRTAYLKQEQDSLKNKLDPEATPDPLSQYLLVDDIVGLLLPDSLILPFRKLAFLADGSTYNRADYPKLWQLLEASSILVSQALIDAEPEKYAANYGDGDGVTTFTVPNYTLRPHLAVAGVFGAVGSTIEDRIQHMSGYIGEIGSIEAGSALQYRSAGGAFYSMNKTRNIPSSLGGYTPISDAAVSVGFNAALVVRTGDTTEVNSSFLNFYIIHGEVA